MCKTIEILGRQNAISSAPGLTVQAHAVHAEAAWHLKTDLAPSAG